MRERERRRDKVGTVHEEIRREGERVHVRWDRLAHQVQVYVVFCSSAIGTVFVILLIEVLKLIILSSSKSLSLVLTSKYNGVKKVCCIPSSKILDVV